MEDLSFATGQLDQFDASLAITPVKGNPFEAENFYPADAFYLEAAGCEAGYSRNLWGDCMKNRKKGPSRFDGDEMSEAAGRARRAKKRAFRQAGKQQRRELVASALKSRQGARDLRSQAKLEMAKGQRAAGESMGKESQSDIQLANALSKSSATEKKSMSTTTKVLIGFGVIAVLGAVTYFVIKNRKK